MDENPTAPRTWREKVWALRVTIAAALAAVIVGGAGGAALAVASDGADSGRGGPGGFGRHGGPGGFGRPGGQQGLRGTPPNGTPPATGVPGSAFSTPPSDTGGREGRTT